MIQQISLEDFKKIYDQDSDVLLIDVRENDEWNQAHIPRAQHIPKDEIASRIKDHSPDLSQPLYLHCRSGVRSLQAAQTLENLGYKAVYSIDGGILAWANAGYPIA